MQSGVESRQSRVWLSVASVCALLLCTLPVRAQTATDARNAARQVASDITAEKGAGTFDAAAQRRAVDRLGKSVLQFIDLSDRAANAGSEGREHEGLGSLYQAISQPLEAIYEQNSSSLERMSKRVMDEDGDLEALYETQPFKDAQLVASQALYFLNWFHYYGARLYEGARRKELLEKAQRGFSEFAVGDRRTELLVESLLGRGLCHLELGNFEFGVHDLQAVINEPQASPERKSKARLALLDAYVQAGNTAEAFKLSDQMLGTAGRAEDNVVRFLRIRALLAAVKNAPGADAARYRQQALALMDQLRRAGGGWEEKVTALAQTGIDNPEKWSDQAAGPFAKWALAKLLVQKGDYKQAMPLLEGVVTTSDVEVRKHLGEAQYLLGLAKFQAGQYQEAAQALAAVLKEPTPAYGADAAYMRFKSMEVLVAKSSDADLSAQYEQAVRTYLARYPDHRSVFEARFRLGELLQAQRKFADARQAYAAVHGDPAFELRAQFATLQCDFEILQASDHQTPAAERDALLKEIGAGLQRFEEQVATCQKSKSSTDQLPLLPMRAKAAIMKAVYLTLQPTPNDEAVLAALLDFEKKYPDQTDLFPQLTRLRLAAYEHLGRFAEAEAEVKAHGPLLLSSVGTPTVENLALGFVREGARRRSKGDQTANHAAQQVALHLYELLVSESEGTDKDKLTLARLYENTAEPGKAAALYSEILKRNVNSLTALRGLGRTAEAQHQIADALRYWQQLTAAVRPGDVPWYEGSYQIARLKHSAGETQQACELLEQLKPAMPGLSDADLREQLDALYEQACR